MLKLSFGDMRFPLLNENDGSAVDMKEVNQMVDYFMDNGFNYFDTAYVYHKGKSEEVLRKSLVERYDRNRFCLADKMPTFSITDPKQYDEIFKEQLHRCGVTYFDYYLLHNITQNTYLSTVKYGGFEYLKKLKEEGKAKKIGFSFHDTPELLDEILTQYQEMAFVQLQINYIDWESATIQSRRCYEVARKHKKPIIVMEPVKGGGLANLPEDALDILKSYNSHMSPASWAIRYAASLEGVIMVLSGMSDFKQMQDNISYMKEFKPLTIEEHAVIGKVVKILTEKNTIPCTSCQYCVDDCPKNNPIPAYFTIYNGSISYGNGNFPGMHYRRQSFGRGKASECIECGQCESHCPQHIPIIPYLKAVAEKFE